MAEEFECRIDVRISEKGRFGGDQLCLMETIVLGPSGFLGLASVLGRFHELARIEAERAKASKS